MLIDIVHSALNRDTIPEYQELRKKFSSAEVKIIINNLKEADSPISFKASATWWG